MGRRRGFLEQEVYRENNPLDRIRGLEDRTTALERTALSAAPTRWKYPGLLNGWTNESSGSYQDAGYIRDAQGYVHLRGRITSGMIGNSAFILPEDHRPAKEMTFAVASNGAYGQVAVQVDGNVIPAVGSSTWISLDGITFKV